MARRQAQTLLGHQIDVGIVDWRHGGVNGGNHRLVLMRPGHGQHTRMRLANQRLVLAQAAGDDHTAIGRHGFADRVEAFGTRTVEKPAGVDDDHVGAIVIPRDCIPLGAQLRQDAFAVDQRLRAAERDKADFRGFAPGRWHWCLHGSGRRLPFGGHICSVLGHDRVLAPARCPPQGQTQMRY